MPEIFGGRMVRVSLGYTGTLEDRWAQFERRLNHVVAI